MSCRRSSPGRAGAPVPKEQRTPPNRPPHSPRSSAVTRRDGAVLGQEDLLERRLAADEAEQLGPVLERADEPDFLLVALRVLAEAPRRIEVEALDQRLRIAGVVVPPQVREVLDRLGARQAVIEGELAGQVADPSMDRDRIG